MLINRKFILASNSLSRYRLLKNAGLNFVKTKPLCNEENIKKKLIINNTKQTSFAKILAKEKALSVSQKKPKELVVGSDTIIIFKKKIINKAKNMNEAKKKNLKNFLAINTKLFRGYRFVIWKNKFGQNSRCQP